MPSQIEGQYNSSRREGLTSLVCETKAALSAAKVALNRAELAKSTAVQVPASQSKFAWGPERIGSELLQKFDSFTARREDHTRKLLWTFGTDPQFKGSDNKASLTVTPQNFPKMTDRFGVACTEQQAESIFRMHGLPTEGCSLQKLTSAFSDSRVDMATIARDQARRMHGDAARPATLTRARSPKAPHRPYALASLPGEAWARHAAGL